ncbi:hypothetical protein [Shewanella woodyi]|uniref:hypothetical protein n=1 Tax=Shewanella woodyi TaxID=60961 RepID=UPI0037496C58
MDHKQAWMYQGDAPKAGRKLLLLEPNELTIALPLIFRLVHPEEVIKKTEWFLSSIAEDDANRNLKYIALIPLLQKVTQLRKSSEPILTSLKELNDNLNEYFSDHGWRMVRKELSQIKKRQKKSHIELSKDIIAKLKIYMEDEKFESFDQAIDNLIAEAKYKNAEREE